MNVDGTNGKKFDGRRPKLKITSMEYDLNGRQSQLKTTSMQDNLKMTSMEDDCNGRQPQGKRFSRKSILMEVNLFLAL